MTPPPRTIPWRSMKILYAVGFGGWWGQYPPNVLDLEDGDPVGGGETAALSTAFRLAALGHDVTYCSVAQPGEHNGVRFLPKIKYVQTLLQGGPWDAVVAWSNIEYLKAVPRNTAVRLFAQQVNDISHPQGWEDHVDCIVSPSMTHAGMMEQIVGEQAKKDVGFSVCYNGMDPSLYDNPPDPKDRPMTVGWWSSPDRGLVLLLQAWPLIKSAVPDAKLQIFYKVLDFVRGAAQHPGWPGVCARALKELLIAVQGLDVEVIDQIPRRRLSVFQRQCRVQAYPCAPDGFTEGFACSINEALMAGALTVTRPVDAFYELWNGPVKWIESHPAQEGFLEEVAAKVVWGLTEWAEDPNRSPSLEDMRNHAMQFTWERSGAQMEAIIKDTIRGKRLSPKDIMGDRYDVYAARASHHTF